MLYYAAQDKQKGATDALRSAPPVIHVFETLSARNAWVKRGSANGVAYRHPIGSKQVKQASDSRMGSAVRHRNVGRASKQSKK